MNHLEIAKELERNKKVFKHLLHNLDIAQYMWRPQPGKWCLLEIICHLYDEEREDFRARIKHVLETPEELMPPIDPQGWVTARKYIEQDYEKVLGQFIAERERSVTYLLFLYEPAWGNTYQHPKLGPVSAGLFLNNWLAHDYLHIRQITATKYACLKANAGVPLGYAGDW